MIRKKSARIFKAQLFQRKLRKLLNDKNEPKIQNRKKLFIKQ